MLTLSSMKAENKKVLLENLAEFIGLTLLTIAVVFLYCCM